MEETYTNNKEEVPKLTFHNCTINIGHHRYLPSILPLIELKTPVIKTKDAAIEGQQRVKTKFTVKQILAWCFFEWKIGITVFASEKDFKRHISHSYMPYNSKTRRHEIINEDTLSKEFSNLKNLQSDFNPQAVMDKLVNNKVKLDEFNIIDAIKQHNSSISKVKV